MAPSKTLEVSRTREGAMPEIILPSPMVGLLAAFEPCFHAPSYRIFRLLVAGWLHCLGRRTITAVALASGGVGQRHISVFHRFFTRATWSLDAVGQVVFRLALAWIPADQPLFILVDDTLARKTGKGIALATMHHDPLLSSARKPFCSFGHVWVVLALWVPLPMGGSRGFALPLLFRLYVGSKRGGTKDAPGRPRKGTRQQVAEQAHAAHPRPTKLALARELLALVAGWADGRTIYAVVDSAFILTGYARRWTIEVTFHDQKQFLGFEDPQNQTPEAVARTAPMAGIVYDLVLLWYAARLQHGHATGWLVRPWYRSKTTPSFLDMLTAVRQESWRPYFSDPPLPGPATQKSAHSWATDLLATT